MKNFFMRTTKTLIRLCGADLSLRWVHMSEGTFFHFAVSLKKANNEDLNFGSNRYIFG